MKKRFVRDTGHVSGTMRVLIPLMTFAVVLIFVVMGIRSMDDTMNVQEMKRLEDSIMKSSVQCYALEGHYPESLQYLKDNYGVIYDDDRYMVDYQIYGANMLPNIKILPLD